MSIAVKIGKMSELPDFEQYFKAKKTQVSRYILRKAVVQN